MVKSICLVIISLFSMEGTLKFSFVNELNELDKGSKNGSDENVAFASIFTTWVLSSESGGTYRYAREELIPYEGTVISLG